MEAMVQKLVIALIGIVLLGAVGFYFFGDSLPSFGQKPINTARFVCDRDAYIDATFYKSSVELSLSDFRTMELPQAISASGARYANADESVVFWNKGDTAFLTESGTETFSNCEIEVAGQAARTSYTSREMGVTVKYPRTYTLNDAYQYVGVPNKPIDGVKLTIPGAMATGTNLSMDTGVSVEQLPRALNCTGDIFLLDNVKASAVTENGVTYSVATTSGAAAGNRYEETVYAVTGSKPCTAVRYFIHSMAIENFDPGAVRAFDRAALLADFDKIRSSLVLTVPSATSSAQ